MIIVKTPLRLSFVGGGSDIKTFYEKKDGMVISTAIDKYVYVIVKSRFDDMIYINYTNKERVNLVDEIQHNLVREAMRMTGVEKGIEITTLADIPSEGSGLGSSSSITVALLHAFYTFRNELVTAEQLAKEACRIEIDVLGKPIGKQDQYAAAYGGMNQFIFHKNGIVERIPIHLEFDFFMKFSSSLVLYYTGITRSADNILSEQKRNFNDGEKFKIMSEIVSLVEPFINALRNQDLRKCGLILDKNWELKQKMASGINNESIEFMYKKAKDAGAIGGKVAGAGGGGFMIFIVPKEKQNSFFNAMRGHRLLPFMLERSGSRVVFDDRRYSSK